MRVRKKAWAKEELENNPHMVHQPQQWKGKWTAFFGNNNPIYVEIGCGKGGFITQNAQAFSDINFIGIERQSTIAAIAARRMPPELKNIALICGRAEGLAEVFTPGELKRLYINFCDPWPKKKWAKRRLTYHGFLEGYKEVFGNRGELFFKTDNKGLFEFSLNEFCGNDWKLSNITLDLHNSGYEGNIMTEYEKRFSQMGMPIYRLEARFEKDTATERK